MRAFLLALLMGLSTLAYAQDPAAVEELVATEEPSGDAAPALTSAVESSDCPTAKAIGCDVGVGAALGACVVTEGEACIEALEVLVEAGCCDCLPDGTVKEWCNALKTGGEDAKAGIIEAVEKQEPAAADDKPADAEPAADLTDEEALETVGLLVKALQNGQWPLAFGLLLTVLVYAASRFGLKDVVGAKALPWVTMGVAVAGTIGAGLVAGLEITQVITQGVLAGVAAIGGWELLLKHLLPKKEEPKAEEPAAEETGDADTGDKTDPGVAAPKE